jgi:transcriptional regulator with XRE-family HTH domain
MIRRIALDWVATPPADVIGQRVRIARSGMKPPVSQEDLSGRLARLGIQMTQTSISKLENRQRYVMDYEAAAIAKALKVSVAWLFGDEQTSGSGASR